jgi:hypothetical protein
MFDIPIFVSCIVFDIPNFGLHLLSTTLRHVKFETWFISNFFDISRVKNFLKNCKIFLARLLKIGCDGDTSSNVSQKTYVSCSISLETLASWCSTSVLNTLNNLWLFPYIILNLRCFIVDLYSFIIYNAHDCGNFRNKLNQYNFLHIRIHIIISINRFLTRWTGAYRIFLFVSNLNCLLMNFSACFPLSNFTNFSLSTIPF